MITLLHRPYVFAFLIAFLVIAGRHLGLRRTLCWLVSGFAIAVASEASSIRNGFPYGMYHYIYENLQGEWLLFGVPVWDSLSYPFMIYAGYAMAVQFQHTHLRTYALTHSILGAFLTMVLDIIIDPLTVLGDRWFLGHIYYYPHGGPYFGIPLTNFAGWFLVPCAVIFFNQLLWRFRRRHVAERVTPDGAVRGQDPPPSWLGALFYLSIACFNIAITFWIGEWHIGLASLGWLSIPVGMLFFRSTGRHPCDDRLSAHAPPDDPQRAHR